MQSTLWQLGLTWHTLVDWGNFVRDVCSEDVRRHPIQLGGLDANGDPIIVEIDESKFFNRKYNRGQGPETDSVRDSSESDDPRDGEEVPFDVRRA